MKNLQTHFRVFFCLDASTFQICSALNTHILPSAQSSSSLATILISCPSTAIHLGTVGQMRPLGFGTQKVLTETQTERHSVVRSILNYVVKEHSPT